MRRLSMKTKRSKSETSGSDSEENGVRHLTITDNNDEMKKGKENKNTESQRRGTAKKRPARTRQRETTEDSALNSEVEDTQAVDTGEENKNVGKPGPSKKLKRESQKGSSLTKQDGNNEKEYEVY